MSREQAVKAVFWVLSIIGVATVGDVVGLTWVFEPDPGPPKVVEVTVKRLKWAGQDVPLGLVQAKMDRLGRAQLVVDTAGGGTRTIPAGDTVANEFQWVVGVDEAGWVNSWPWFIRGVEVQGLKVGLDTPTVPPVRIEPEGG